MAQQWYLAIGGQKVGPLSEDDIIRRIRGAEIDAGTLVFTSGMTNWTPLGAVPALAACLPGAAALVPGGPPPVPGRRAHDIAFEVHGTEMQFVEVALDPGESAIAEAGALMFMTDGIQMETIFGDGSAPSGGGIMDALLGAGKRLLTGESLFMTVFTNQGRGEQKVAFAAPYAGKILALDLATLGGELICQKDSFLCAAKGVSIGIAFQKKIGVGLFGGEGFIMQRLKGDGLCFAHAGGTDSPARSEGRRDAARRHGMPRRAAAERQLRHPVRRQGEDGALRRRGHLLRRADGPRQGLAAVAALQPPGRPHRQGRSRRTAPGGRLGPRQGDGARQSPRRQVARPIRCPGRPRVPGA